MYAIHVHAILNKKSNAKTGRTLLVSEPEIVPLGAVNKRLSAIITRSIVGRVYFSNKFPP